MLVDDLDIIDLEDLLNNINILAELYGYYHEKELPVRAFEDGLISAEERDYLLDD